MSDLISREAALAILYECGGDEITPPNMIEMRGRMHRLPAVDAVEVGSCDGCIYGNRKRPQKCSCCRRNRDLKDCYERREENERKAD